MNFETSSNPSPRKGAFAQYRTTGSLGQFEGFLACLWSASFSISMSLPGILSHLLLTHSHSRRRPRIYFDGICRGETNAHLHQERLQDRLH